MANTYVIDNNEARVPFFGDKMTFITGLDPLGLQNPSVKAYSNLLPGLNNVTGQLRAYSFYCWLLNEYAQIIKSTNPKDQKVFVRRAEYIIALISQVADIPGISGRLYAGKQVESNNTFDLQKGTYNDDGSTINTYWQYPFGIFGQYYVGSMRQIGVIDEPTNEKGEFLGIYRITTSKEELKVSGEELSTAFNEQLNPDKKKLFLEKIESGIISIDELKSLADDFNLRSITPNSREWRLLIDMLLSIDEPLLKSEEPKTLRKQTIKHLLKFVEQYPNQITDRVFTMFAYDNKGSLANNVDECLLGWYFYQFNEYWQVGCTSMFNGSLSLLESLKGPGWLPTFELVNQSCDIIVDVIADDKKINIPQNFSFNNIIIDYSERELYNLLMTRGYERRLAYGFLLVIKVYLANHKTLGTLIEYVANNELNNCYDGITYYKSLSFEQKYDLDDFIKSFLKKNIINRHQVVAYRKMGNGSQSTQKFLIEEGLIRQIGNFEPGFSSPRIGNVITFLLDLSLISTNGSITEKGKSILQKLLSDEN